MNILFICNRNAFESPLAEAFSKKENEKRKTDFSISSAGLNAKDGEFLPEDTIKIGKKFGFDLSKKKTKRLDEKMIKDADLIFTANIPLTVALRSYYLEYTDKIFVLSSKIYSNEEADDVYKKCAEEIENSVKRIFDKIENGTEKSD